MLQTVPQARVRLSELPAVLIGYYGNPKHAIMWPTQDELASARQGCTRSKTSTALALLEDAGVLVKLSFTGQRNLAYVFTYLYREWYARHDLPVLPKDFRSRLTPDSARKLADVLVGDHEADDDDAETRQEADDPRQEATDQSERTHSRPRFEGQGTPSIGKHYDLIEGVDY